MNDRKLILTRVRKALDRVPRPTPEPPGYEGPPLPLITDETELLRVFKKEAESQDVKVQEASCVEEAIVLLSTTLKERNVKTVFSWNDTVRKFDGILQALDSLGIRDLAQHPRRPDHASPRKDFIKSASHADAGITGADFALADTGSLVMLTSPGKSRSASLLPPIHLALLSSHRILPDSNALMRQLSWGNGTILEYESAITLITGTSKTADIELTLVRGVHGPEELHVIICHHALP